MRCTSSSTRTNGSRSPRSAARRGMATSSILGARPDNSSRSSSHTGPVRSRAATTWASSTTESLSPGPSCTHPLALGSRPTPLRDESRLPVTRRRRDQYHPAALCGHLLPLTGEAALPPKAGQPGLEASTPGPVAWSRKGQSYSSLGPPRHPGSRASQASRRYATRQSWTPETKTKVPEQARAARHLVPSLDHERVDCHRPTHRGQGPRQHLGQEVAPFARTKSHYLKINTAGPPHREMPLLGAQYMDSLDGTRA